MYYINICLQFSTNNCSITMEMSPKKLWGLPRLPFEKFLVCAFCSNNLYRFCGLGSACTHSSKGSWSKDVEGMCSGTCSVASGICSLGILPCLTVMKTHFSKCGVKIMSSGYFSVRLPWNHLIPRAEHSVGFCEGNLGGSFHQNSIRLLKAS